VLGHDLDTPVFVRDGFKVYPEIESLTEMMFALLQEADHSISELVVAGHGWTARPGAALAGVSFNQENKKVFYIHHLKPGHIQLIKRKIKPGGRVIIASCNAGINERDMQRLAKALGVPVLGYVGQMNEGYYGQCPGQWKVFPADGGKPTIYK